MLPTYLKSNEKQDEHFIRVKSPHLCDLRNKICTTTVWNHGER